MNVYISYLFSCCFEIKKIEKIKTNKIKENFETKNYVLMVDFNLLQNKNKIQVKTKEQFDIEEIYVDYNEEDKTITFIQEMIFDKNKFFDKEDFIDLKVEKIEIFELENLEKPLFELKIKNSNEFGQILNIKIKDKNQ